MDDNSFNIHNRLLGYSRSPIFSKTSTSIENMPKENVTKKSEHQNECSVDLDQSDSEENSFKNISAKNMENSKLEYRRKLIANLNNKRNQISDFGRHFDKKSESEKRPVAIKRTMQHIDTEHPSPQICKSKTNYRTICDDIDSKPPKQPISSTSKLDNSGFLSLSRQSLNESLNDSGITNTASRISANIVKQNLSQKTETSPKSIPNSAIVAKYPTRTHRYRTITKRDNFSSYLTRVASDVDMFGGPASTNAAVALNLNLSENQSSKRVDFSKIIKTPVSKPPRSDAPLVSGQSWSCTNCEASNPPSFNFCPICSASNPKLTLSGKLNLKRFYEDRSKSDWMCPRCSTKNDESRDLCIFCFKNKKDSLDNEKPFIKKRKINENSDEIVQEKEAFQFTENEKDPKFAFGDIPASAAIFKFASNIDPPSKIDNINIKEINKAKWNCPTCLVDNEPEKDSCVCCMTKNPNAKSSTIDKEKPLLIFGNNSSQNISFKFGSQGNDEKPKFEFGNTSTIKFGSNIDSSSKINTTNVKEINKSKWNCPTCLVDNEPEKDSCVCCMTKNPNGKSSKIDKSKWNCPTCLVDNEPEKDSCVCCMTKNPNAKSSTVDKEKPLLIFGNSSSQNVSFKFGSQGNDEKPKFEFGNTSTFKFGSNIDSPIKLGSNVSSRDIGTVPSAGKWNCPTCMVDNDADKDACPCCMTKNPNIKSMKINTGKEQPFKFGHVSTSGASIKFGSNVENPSKTAISNGISQPKKWNCPTCFVDNSADAEKCPCCATKNPNIPSDKLPVFKFGNDSSSARSPIKLGSSIDSSSKINNIEAKWNCPTCMVDNAADKDCCPCCSTKNPNIKSSSSSKIDNIKPLFSFGTNSSSSTPPQMKFGSTVPSVNGIDPVVSKSLTFQFGGSHVAPSAENGVVNAADSTDLVFLFSPATSLGISSSAQVPVDLDFEFEAPLLL